MNDELRVAFHTELASIRGEVVQLGQAVRDAIPRATTILLTGDLHGADHLIGWDDEIDARTLDLEERCASVIALQAPVAIDLRLVLAVSRIIIEIERSADLLVNICKATHRINTHPLDPRLHDGLTAMSEQATNLYRGAIYAFAADDADKAATLDDLDTHLDNLHNQFIQSIFQSHATGNIDLQAAVQLAVVARFYERIGDHAVNIAERVRYLVTGWLPEHEGAARYRATHPPSVTPDGTAPPTPET